MIDLIDRQAAIDAADKIIKRDTNGNNVVVQAMIAWKCYVEQLPSAQPETATWVPESDRRNHWHCSKCGYVIGVLKMDAKFCPNCGAHMEVVNGRWIDETVVTGTTTGETTVIKQYRCSVCGNLFGRVDDNFCGRCGAEMDLEAEDG